MLVLWQQVASANRLRQLAHDASFVGIIRPLNLPDAAIVLIQQKKREDILRFLKCEAADVCGCGWSKCLIVQREATSK